MLFLLTCVLSSFFLPAACQFDDSDSDGFHPDPLTAGLFGVLCIFALLYGVLSIWTLVALFTSRGHRGPYAFQFPAILFFAWSNAAYIGWLIIENIPVLNANSFFSDVPVLLLPSLGFVSNLLFDWGVVLQFLVLIAVLWNRETVLRIATDGKFGGHHPVLIALHVTLATLTFIFGTASEAYGMDTAVKFNDTDRFESRLYREYLHRIQVRQQLNYVFNAFAILMVIDVAVTTSLLWRAWRKAGISDKITNLMLYVVVPLYSIFGLLLMIFTILFSPSGLSADAGPEVFEGANLAYSILVTGISITILFFILALSVKKAYWNPGGVAEPSKQQYWVPQPQYIYAAPPQVPQAGYYAQQPMAYGQPQPQMYAGPDSPQQMQYAQPHESAPGSYASPMQASPGSYTPPHAAGQPVYAEKTG
ncbi:hypothetical protein MVEN_01777600 [Mycena venus]|uniref:Uncharacterized protein n=1 Tax=Mycena venus TaxID=2733690 RepID=A0A8H6XLH2_9AGAR|nr:hypothetical protein MVEN_01777600 [Mycena venus]